MKLFHFYRDVDASGVSGTGLVVEGVEFTNGWCAIRWLSAMPSMCFYQSIEDVKKVHSHGGKTQIVVHDFEAMKKPPEEKSDARFEILLGIIDEAARLNTLSDDLEQNRGQISQSMAQLRYFLDELEVSMGVKMRRSA